MEFEHHKGTCDKAANWVNVGRTIGRGKKSINNKALIGVSAKNGTLEISASLIAKVGPRLTAAPT